jgi:hypothetical protein
MAILTIWFISEKTEKKLQIQLMLRSLRLREPTKLGEIEAREEKELVQEAVR